jgi:hypothetical protein
MYAELHRKKWTLKFLQMQDFICIKGPKTAAVLRQKIKDTLWRSIFFNTNARLL